MKLLLENQIFESDELVEKYAESFDSIFKKMSIYSRNSRLGLVNEGKHNDRNIYLNEDEVYATKVFAAMMQYAYVETLLKERSGISESEALDEGFGTRVVSWILKVKGDKAEVSPDEQKEIAKDKGKQKELINDIDEEMPEESKGILKFIMKVLKKGIKDVQELVEFIGNAIEKIGNNSIGGLFKALGLIKNFSPESKVEEGKVYSYKEYINESFDINSDEYKKYTEKSVEEYGDVLKKEAIDSESDDDTKSVMSDLIDDTIIRNGEKKGKANESAEYTIEKLIESARTDSELSIMNFIKNFKENNKFIKSITALKAYKDKENRPTFGEAVLGGVKKLLKYFLQLLISFVGSWLVEKALPMLLKFGSKIGMTVLPAGWIVIVVKICWYTFGYVRILENRYKEIANNPAEEEHFFNVKVTLGLLAKTMNLLGTSIPSASGMMTKWFTSLEPVSDIFSGVTGNLNKLLFGFCKIMASEKSDLTGNAFNEFVTTNWIESAKELGFPDMIRAAGIDPNSLKAKTLMTEYSTMSPSKLDKKAKKELDEDIKKEGLNDSSAVEDPGSFGERIQALANKYKISIILQPFAPKEIMKSERLKDWCANQNPPLDIETVELGTGASVYPVAKNGNELSKETIKSFNDEFNKLASEGEFGKKTSIKDLDGIYGRAFVGTNEIELVTPVEIRQNAMFFNLIHGKVKPDTEVFVGKNRKDKDTEFLSKLGFIKEVTVGDIDKYASGIESWDSLKSNINDALKSEIESLKATKEESKNWFKKNNIDDKIESLGKLKDRKVIAIYALIKKDDEDKEVPVSPDSKDAKDIKSLEVGDGGDTKALGSGKENKEIGNPKYEVAKKDEGVEEKKEESSGTKSEVKPLMVFSCDIMKGCDVIKNEKWRRKNTYELKGCFENVTIAPANKSDDNDVKDAISKLLVGVLKTSAKTIVDSFAGLGIEKKKGKYVLSEESKADPSKPMSKEIYGSLTINDILEILNTEEGGEGKLYTDFYSEGAGKSEEEKESIKNKKIKYINDVIIPCIEDKDSDLHKELYGNDKLHNWLFPEGEFVKEVILDDEEVMDAISSPMAAYVKDSKLTRKQALNIGLSADKEEDKENKKRNDRIKTLASIIWSYDFSVEGEGEDANPEDIDKTPESNLPDVIIQNTKETDDGKAIVSLVSNPELDNKNVPKGVNKDGKNLEVFDERLIKALVVIRDFDMRDVDDPKKTWKEKLMPIFEEIGVDTEDSKEIGLLMGAWQAKIRNSKDGKTYTIKYTKDENDLVRKVKRAVDKVDIEDATIVDDATKISKKGAEKAKKEYKSLGSGSKSNTKLGERATKFGKSMIRRFNGGDTPEKHEDFLEEAKKKCPLLYKDGKVDDELVMKPYVASTLQQIFNTGKYKKEEYDETAKAKINKVISKSSYKGDKDKLVDTIYNAYLLIKEYKQKNGNEWKKLKEGVVSFSEYASLDDFERPDYPELKERLVLSFEEFFRE